jgi:pimeloyl-ACP methyl ester carboxylesterase
MTTAATPPTTQTPTESTVDLLGQPLTLRRGGTGSPLVLLPHDTGIDGWGPFHAALADHHDVVAPVLPGFDGTTRFEWMRSVRDMAAVMQLLLDRLGLARYALVGLGFGGWLAAEMATTGQARLSHLVLVGAAGLQPSEGEITDQFLLSHNDYVRAGFASDAAYESAYGGEPDIDRLVRWDENREMTGRIAWKPYMHNPSLAHLLAEVRTPALIVSGAKDGVVPPVCTEQYATALPNARRETLDDAGHHADIEQPQALAAAITRFTSAG